MKILFHRSNLKVSLLLSHKIENLLQALNIFSMSFLATAQNQKYQKGQQEKNIRFELKLKHSYNNSMVNLKVMSKSFVEER